MGFFEEILFDLGFIWFFTGPGHFVGPRIFFLKGERVLFEFLFFFGREGGFGRDFGAMGDQKFFSTKIKNHLVDSSLSNLGFFLFPKPWDSRNETAHYYATT